MSKKDQQSLLSQRSVLTIRQKCTEGEKSPFLTEPVRLTPAWEASNLSNDELNFKGMTMDRAKMEISPPKDKYLIVYFIFILHGIGTLMPWNMFITAKSYFVDFKLNEGYTGLELEYAKNFLSYLGFASQIPNVIFNWLNIFVPLRGNLTQRIVWSILFEVVIFLVTIILAMANTSEWPGLFFWLTMLSVVLLNMANGIFQNTIYGMAAKLPIRYTGAVVLGSNISGVFVTIISMASEAVSSTHRTAAIYYFITAMFVLLLCFDTYFALPLNRFYRYNELMNEKEGEKSKTADRPSYWTIFRQSLTIFKQCWPQLFNVFFVFFVTLSVFPSVYSDIKPYDPKNFPIPEKFFASVTCFLTFNICAMLGSLLTSWVNWPKPKYLVWFVLPRIIFIPFFLFCNYHPKLTNRILPIYITNDWVYWIMGAIMSFSSGYLSSLGMMYTPKCVSPQYAVTAGMFAAAMLITGIFTGILFSMLCPYIITYIGW